MLTGLRESEFHQILQRMKYKFGAAFSLSNKIEKCTEYVPTIQGDIQDYYGIPQKEIAGNCTSPSANTEHRHHGTKNAPMRFQVKPLSMFDELFTTVL